MLPRPTHASLAVFQLNTKPWLSARQVQTHPDWEQFFLYQLNTAGRLAIHVYAREAIKRKALCGLLHYVSFPWQYANLRSRSENGLPRIPHVPSYLFLAFYALPKAWIKDRKNNGRQRLVGQGRVWGSSTDEHTWAVVTRKPTETGENQMAKIKQEK